MFANRILIIAAITLFSIPEAFAGLGSFQMNGLPAAYNFATGNFFGGPNPNNQSHTQTHDPAWDEDPGQPKCQLNYDYGVAIQSMTQDRCHSLCASEFRDNGFMRVCKWDGHDFEEQCEIGQGSQIHQRFVGNFGACQMACKDIPLQAEDTHCTWAGNDVIGFCWVHGPEPRFYGVFGSKDIYYASYWGNHQDCQMLCRKHTANHPQATCSWEQFPH